MEDVVSIFTVDYFFSFFWKWDNFVFYDVVVFGRRMILSNPFVLYNACIILFICFILYCILLLFTLFEIRCFLCIWAWVFWKDPISLFRNRFHDCTEMISPYSILSHDSINRLASSKLLGWGTTDGNLSLPRFFTQNATNAPKSVDPQSIICSNNLKGGRVYPPPYSPSLLDPPELLRKKTRKANHNKNTFCMWMIAALAPFARPCCIFLEP